MHRGFIRFWRKTKDCSIYEPNRPRTKLEAWIDILMEVRHSELPKDVVIGMKLFTVERGQGLYSIGTWAKRWNWTESMARRFIMLLSKLDMVSVEGIAGKTTRLSVLNYNTYNPLQQTNEGHIDEQVKFIRSSSEVHPTTNKNVKNDKNDKNEEPSIEFVNFWNLYPKKIGKGESYKSWKKIKPNKELVKKIMLAVREQSESEQWTKDNRQYVPNPATWLNQGRWDDELSPRRDSQNGIHGRTAKTDHGRPNATGTPDTRRPDEIDWDRNTEVIKM